MDTTIAPLLAHYPDATIQTRRPSAEAYPPPTMRFSQVMGYRRSERRMSSPTIIQVVDVLRFSSALQSGWSYRGIERHCAPPISGGGLHGIDLVIVPRTGRGRLLRYDRALDRLEILRLSRPEKIAELTRRVFECLPEARGAVIGLIADVLKYRATYEGSDSLVWRDSGALLQVIAMSAFAFGLACCPVGLHGREIVEGLVGKSARIAACGIVQIGRYVPADPK